MVPNYYSHLREHGLIMPWAIVGKCNTERHNVSGTCMENNLINTAHMTIEPFTNIAHTSHISY